MYRTRISPGEGVQHGLNPRHARGGRIVEVASEDGVCVLQDILVIDSGVALEDLEAESAIGLIPVDRLAVGLDKAAGGVFIFLDECPAGEDAAELEGDALGLEVRELSEALLPEQGRAGRGKGHGLDAPLAQGFDLGFVAWEL